MRAGTPGINAKKISQMIKEQRPNMNCNAKRVQSILAKYENGTMTEDTPVSDSNGNNGKEGERNEVNYITIFHEID